LTHGRATLERTHYDRRGFLAGAAVALVVAVALFSQFNLHSGLRRDEAIYAYGGQQLVDGVPFYTSIFDAKPPVAATIAGAGVAIGRTLGVTDLSGARLAFFVFACLSVLAVYLLGAWLFTSSLSGLVAAAAFVSFEGFAADALTGPNAKTPGVFFAVLTMALLVRRSFLAAGVAGALAFLVWQPLGLYLVVALVAALLMPTGDPWWRPAARVLAGAAFPFAVTAAYYWLEGALDDLVDGVFVYPFTDLDRGGQTFGERLGQIADVVAAYYPEVLFYGGVTLLLVAAAVRFARGRKDVTSLVRCDPLINVVLLSFLLVVAVSIADFQGYPDLYPALSYAAIGVAAGFDLLRRRLDATGARFARVVAKGVAVVVVAALVISSGVTYTRSPSGDQLRHQLRNAESVQGLLDDGEMPYVYGDPTPLVLTGLRSQSPYIYLAAGVDNWVIDHTPGGLAGWQAQIAADDPPMIILSGGWKGEVAEAMERWLETRYPSVRRGELKVFLRPSIYQ
jgi:4-amino-4-deoxy-L-arabinose transferase-like glycosyltransferase